MKYGDLFAAECGKRCGCIYSLLYLCLHHVAAEIICWQAYKRYDFCQMGKRIM